MISRKTGIALLMGSVGLWTVSEPLGAQEAPGTTWKVEVMLNGHHLLWAHAHVGPQESAGIDKSCVAQDGLRSLLGGAQFLQTKGSNLEAMMVGAGSGAVLRVQRPGRISSQLHTMGKETYFPLADLARALGAKPVREGPARFNLFLPKSDPRAILALNDKP
jgi:hypothetical protein